MFTEFAHLPLSYATRQKIKSVPGLLWLRRSFSGGEARDQFVGAHTRVCLEGFPRSGNSLARLSLHALDLEPKAFAHHTHSIANVRAAVRRAIPTFVMSREPRECCSSLVLFGAARSLEDALVAYMDFYGDLDRYLDGLTVVPYEAVLGDFWPFVEHVATQTHSAIRPSLDRVDFARLVKTPLNGSAREAVIASGPYRTFFPHPLKESRKEQLWQSAADRALHLLERARGLREAILKRAPHRLDAS